VDESNNENHSMHVISARGRLLAVVTHIP